MEDKLIKLIYIPNDDKKHYWMKSLKTARLDTTYKNSKVVEQTLGTGVIYSPMVPFSLVSKDFLALGPN